MFSLLRPQTQSWLRAPIVCLAKPFAKPQQSPFSTTQVFLAKKSKRPKIDKRITLIRYFLQHPLTPRPLRFSRNRFLRHWTIHRAWQLFKSKARQRRELELERQYNSMREACEALRLMDGNGLRVDPAHVAGSNTPDVGRLYRIAMLKQDIWKGVPIEYARIQTLTPSKTGWNHGWKR